MEIPNVIPGDVVATNFGIYQHWSVVSDKKCNEGYPMLISATKRNGTVKEESWSKTTENKHTYKVDVESSKNVSDILKDARSKINSWKYSLSNYNCEHFARWSLDLKMESIQVKNTVAAGALVSALMLLLSPRPKLLKVGISVATIAGIALLATSAPIKQN